MQIVMIFASKEKAQLEIVVFPEGTPDNGELERQSYTYKFSAHFSTAGALKSAEGKILQVSLH